jgi:hypothetical protein
MDSSSGWKAFKRYAAAASAFSSEVHPGDPDAIPRGGGIQDGPRKGPRKAPDPIPPAPTSGPSYTPVPHYQHYQHTGYQSQGCYQWQPPQPYIGSQAPNSHFNQFQRTNSGLAAANGFARHQSPVQVPDQYHPNPAPSAPSQMTNAIGAGPYNGPQGISSPVSDTLLQSQHSYYSDSVLSPQRGPSSPQQDYPYHGPYPTQGQRNDQYPVQSGQRTGSWDMGNGSTTYPPGGGSCVHCGHYIDQ